MVSAFWNSVSSADVRVPASFSWARRRASSAPATEISSACSATSARTVTRSGNTSKKPPPTNSVCSGPPMVSLMRRAPGLRMVMSGAWRASTPSSPETSVAMMNSTSPSNRLRSTLTTRSGNFIPGLPTAWGGRRRTRCAAGWGRSLLLHRFGLRASLVDVAHHVEGLLRQIVVLALEDLLEAAHRLAPRHVLAFATGESLGNAEGLRQESLHLARPRYRLLVVFRQLLHAEDGDDVLQVLVALHDLLHALGGVVVVLADDGRLHEPARRSERVDRRIDPDLDERAFKTKRCAEVGEHGLDRGVGGAVGRPVPREVRSSGRRPARSAAARRRPASRRTCRCLRASAPPLPRKPSGPCAGKRCCG